jgi:hypothetical protein
MIRQPIEPIKLTPQPSTSYPVVIDVLLRCKKCNKVMSAIYAYQHQKEHEAKGEEVCFEVEMPPIRTQLREFQGII